MSGTHFGFESVDEREKAKRVRGVFDSVAPRYDLMNDLMSMGLHRAWKAYTVLAANIQPGDRVLDIAGGTGDLALAFAKKVGATGRVIHTDINEAMLRTGRDRLLDAGVALPTLSMSGLMSLTVIRAPRFAIRKAMSPVPPAMSRITSPDRGFSRLTKRSFHSRCMPADIRSFMRS